MTSLRRLFFFLKRNRKVEFLQSEQNGETIKAAKSLQSWPTLCDPIDGSPSGSPVPGILQARIQAWSGVPCPSPGDLPDPGIKPGYPALQADSLSEPINNHLLLQLS